MLPLYVGTIVLTIIELGLTGNGESSSSPAPSPSL